MLFWIWSTVPTAPALIPSVKRRYQEVYGGPAPAKVNREMLDPFFNRRVQEVVPAGISLPIAIGPAPRLKDEQLFAILEALAEPRATATGREPPLPLY